KSRLFYEKMGKDHINEEYGKDPDYCSHHHMLRIFGDPLTHFICLRTDEKYIHSLGDENEPLLRLFTLLHETTHALIPTDDDLEGEWAADAYAAIRLMQRFGKKAVPLLSEISWHRAYTAVCSEDNHTGHLTTAVLDKIIADSASRDFSRLDHDQTVAA